MKVIINKVIPFKGFQAMCIFPFVFVRKETAGRYTAISDNHEQIHGQQQKEMLLIFFFVWYIVEYLIRLAAYRDRRKAYKKISFEQEAYKEEANLQYLKQRRHYAWAKFLLR